MGLDSNTKGLEFHYLLHGNSVFGFNTDDIDSGLQVRKLYFIGFAANVLDLAYYLSVEVVYPYMCNRNL